MHWLLVFQFFFFGFQSFAKNKIEDIDVILIRDNMTIGFHAPTGFFLDISAGQNFGSCGFYVMSGKTFDDSPVILYSQIADKSISGDKGIEKLAADVASTYLKQSKSFKIEKQPTYTSKSKQKFEVRYFLNGPSPNNFEAAGYLNINSRVVQVIFSARTESDFKNNIKAFYDTLDRVAPYSSQMPMLSGKCLYPKENKKSDAKPSQTK